MMVTELDEQESQLPGPVVSLESITELSVVTVTGWSAASARATARRAATRPDLRPRRSTASVADRGFAFAPVTVTSKNEPAARLHDPRRRDAAAEVFPPTVGGEDVHVAHDVFTQPCPDASRSGSVVDVAVDGVALARRRFTVGLTSAP